MLIPASAVRALMSTTSSSSSSNSSNSSLTKPAPLLQRAESVTESDSSQVQSCTAEVQLLEPKNTHQLNTGTNNNNYKSSGRWEIMFQGLVAFQKQHNSLKVPRHASWNGQSLYEWIRNNRKHYLNGLKHKTPALSAKRIEALASVGFDFDPTGVLGSNDAYDDKRWVAMFDGLVEYQQRHGNCSVPVGYLCDGRSLLDWLRHQRSQYTNALTGQRPALSKERTQRLLSISGFDLDPTGQRQDRRTEQERWNVMLEGLVDYYERHESFVMPEGYSHDGRSLFSWARNQRRLYSNHQQGIKPAISRDRMKQLFDIGFLEGAPPAVKCSAVVKAKRSHSMALPRLTKAHHAKKDRPRQVHAQPRRLLPQKRIEHQLLQSPAAKSATWNNSTSSSSGSSSYSSSSGSSSGSSSAATAPPANRHPSWVRELALDSLARYQTMTPTERSHMALL